MWSDTNPMATFAVPARPNPNFERALLASVGDPSRQEGMHTKAEGQTCILKVWP